MEVAMLGMGRMGRAMATRLTAGGHRVVAWNRTRGRAPAGVPEAGTVQAAVARGAVVITSLADDDAVRGIANFIRQGLPADAVYADASTVSPALSRELAGTFPRFVSMPVLGGPAAVESGDATYLVGGPAALVEYLRPVLSTLSQSVHRYEAAELAVTAKLATNLLLLAGVAALAESFAVGRSGGLSEDQLCELLGDSQMVAPGVRGRVEGVRTGEMAGWWTTTLGAKDAGLAVQVGKDAGVTLPFAETVHSLYAEAAASGAEDADIVAVARRYRRT
jgi:3-hydroxyisobutyrate dehydrogenase